MSDLQERIAQSIRAATDDGASRPEEYANYIIADLGLSETASSKHNTMVAYETDWLERES
jgi:hypothetical protein